MDKINRKAFHSTLSRATIAVLKTIAAKHGMNQGRIIDYMVQLYLDQVIQDNDQVLQQIKRLYQSDNDKITEVRKANLTNSRVKTGQEGNTDSDNELEDLPGIF